jgi:cephalosporin-C deacetylase
MAFFDMPLEQLETYQPPPHRPSDFDAFWETTLAEARTHPLEARFELVDYALALVEVFDVTFAGYGGQPVKGWLILPRQRQGALPCVVEFIGYSTGRGFGFEWLLYANAGYAHFVMDTRGQGYAWRHGDTPDIAVDGSSPHYPGHMTKGILKPETYYYRRVFTDAVRAVEAARSHPGVDAERICVAGGSQGGGITLAAAALVDDVQLALIDVPFLCDFRRATTLVDSMPYGEIGSFIRKQRHHEDTIFATLAYFDGVHFAPRIKARSLFSVGLMDTICPPSTVYAAYNAVTAPKDIKVYRFNTHDGGGAHHTLEQLRFLANEWSGEEPQ